MLRVAPVETSAAVLLRSYDDCISGGESYFVDAWPVIERLRAEHPTDFATLVRIPATFQKIHYNRSVVRSWVTYIFWYAKYYVYYTRIMCNQSMVFFCCFFSFYFNLYCVPWWSGANKDYYYYYYYYYMTTRRGLGNAKLVHSAFVSNEASFFLK